MGTMQAVWLEEKIFSVRGNLPVPEPHPGEALVQVRLAGVCSTDLEMGKGYYPFTGVPGHEFIGEVAAAPGHSEWLGERVVGEINVACGECPACRANRPTHCSRRQVLGLIDHDGAFAEYLTLPLTNLHRVPASVPDEAAVFTEPLAAALEIQQQVQIHPDDRVLLVGAGRLGQLIAQTLALTGCGLQVVVRRPVQSALLASRGIRTLEVERVQPESYDLVVEATGSPEGFELARRAVRPRGTLVLKSTYAGRLEVDLSRLVVDEITLVGSRCGPFEPALRLLESGAVDPRPLIAARYPLYEGPEALRQAAQPGVLKVLLEPG